MTKQEEIRAGISDRIYGLAHQPPDIDEILKYLHDNDVVIRVDDDALRFMGEIGIYPASVNGGKHPYKERSPYQNGWNDALMRVMEDAVKQNDKLEVVAVEPLVKEG